MEGEFAAEGEIIAVEEKLNTTAEGVPNCCRRRDNSRQKRANTIENLSTAERDPTCCRRRYTTAAEGELTAEKKSSLLLKERP